jgi:hypothetical protein
MAFPQTVAGPILEEVRSDDAPETQLEGRYGQSDCVIERPRQAAWLWVRASEFREPAAMVGSASRQELLGLAARFEELAVDVQRLYT